VSVVTVTGKITTGGDGKGALSHGLVAQSIGGGGGVSDLVVQHGLTIDDSATVTLGSGTGGADGDGSNVKAVASDVETNGAGAFGIVAQSIGGGGGLVGIANEGKTFGDPNFTIGAASVEIVAGDGAGGAGRTATVLAQGDIHTSGFGAHGIVAQSIGGGGGIVGAGMFTTSLGAGPFAGSVGQGGNGGNVNVTTFKNVVVAGESSVGIFGQSAGGSPGNVILTVDHSGNGVGLVWASDGTGAAAQIADGASNLLDTDGTLYAQGSLAGTGTPPVLGGNEFKGFAILGGAGGETITNLAYTFAPLPLPNTFAYGIDYGVAFDIPTGLLDPITGLPTYVGTRTSNIVGNVDLGAGANSLVVESGALFLTDKFVKLGVNNTLTNEGLLSPGDRNNVQTTEIAGSFVQESTGKYFIDIDLNNQNTPNQVNDLLLVSGTSVVGGEGPLLLLSIDKKFNEYVIVTSEGGTTINGFTADLTPPAIGFNFGVKLEDGNKDLVLFADKPPIGDLLRDPSSGTRDPNVFRMGDGIDRIEAAIDTDDKFNRLINLLRLSPKDDPKVLGDAVVSLTPHNAPHMFEITHRRGSDFLDATVECPDTWQEDFAGDKRNCVWAHASYGEYERDSVFDSPLNDDDWYAFTLGGHAAIDANWQVGLGFESTVVDSTQTREGSSLSDLSADIYQFSLSANYVNGPFRIGMVAAASRGDWDSRRWVNINGYSQAYTSFDGIDPTAELPIFSDKKIEFAGINGIAASGTDLTGFAQLLRLSYFLRMSSLELIPFLDVEGHVLHTSERTETGADLANLTYPSQTETTVTFTPGIELGLVGHLGAETLLRGYLRGGVVLAPDNEWAARTQFVAAPEGLPTIKIKERFDEAVFKLLLDANGLELKVNYSGAFSDSTTENEVRGVAAIRF
jgi:hypothetical protein